MKRFARSRHNYTPLHCKWGGGTEAGERRLRPCSFCEVSMTKRIAIATIGTQGDVQPYVALACALQKRGYSVVVGAPDDFEDMVTGHGLEFHSLGDKIQEFLAQSRFEKAMSQSMLVNAP